MVTDSIRNTKKRQTNLRCPVFSSGPSGPKLHWEEGRHGWIVDIKSLLDGEGAIWPFAVFFKAKCFFPVEPQGERFWKYIYIYKSLWLSPLLRAHFVWFIRAVAGGRTVYLFQQWTVPDRKQNYSITSTGVYNGKHLCTALSGQRWRIWLLKLPKALSTGDHDSMMSLRSDVAHDMMKRTGLTPVPWQDLMGFSQRFSSGIQQLTCGRFLVSKVVSNLLVSRPTTELKVTLELKSVHQCVGRRHRCRLILPSLASLWMTSVSNSALWTPVLRKAPA